MTVGVPLFPVIYNINKYRRLAKDPDKYEDEQNAAKDERGKAIALAADSALLKLIQIPALILFFIAYIVNTRTLMIVGVTAGILVVVIWLGRYALRAYYRQKM
jgi:F0F1-type ATP synthase assembly protein I